MKKENKKTNIKTGEIKQEKVIRKKPVGRLLDEIKTEIGGKKLAKKLGISQSTLYRYSAFLRGNKTKTAQKPPKEIETKIKKIASKQKIKVYKNVTEVSKLGKSYKSKTRVKKVFTGKYERLKLTEKINKTVLTGGKYKVIETGARKKIAQALKRKNFSYFFCRIHIEYYVKTVGLIDQWYSFTIKQKTPDTIEKRVSDFLKMKKFMESVLYFKLLELNFEIIEKIKKK